MHLFIYITLIFFLLFHASRAGCQGSAGVARDRVGFDLDKRTRAAPLRSLRAAPQLARAPPLSSIIPRAASLWPSSGRISDLKETLKRRDIASRNSIGVYCVVVVSDT